MKNLMTRRIVLGLLMVLVSAFGMQNIAEAQTIAVTPVSGNYQSQWSGQAFSNTLVFRISGVTASGVDPTGSVTAPSDSLPIVTTGSARIKNVKIGSKTARTSSFTLNHPVVFESQENPAERATAEQNTAISEYNRASDTLGTGSNTITVTLENASVGPGTVTVGGTTYFNLYGMTRPEALGTSISTTVTDVGNSNGVYSVYDNHVPVIMGTPTLFTFAPSNAPVLLFSEWGNSLCGNRCNALEDYVWHAGQQRSPCVSSALSQK